MNKAYKLGSLNEDKDIEYIYPNIWAKEDHGTWSRLTVAPSKNHIELILELLSKMKSPYGILYVLTVSRLGYECGRYQCVQPMTYQKVYELLNEYKTFFETDGRHHLWIASAVTDELIVYDNHNVLYLYNMDEYTVPLLASHEFSESTVKFPSPHTHMYNSLNDVYEDLIMTKYEWKWFPLQEEHDNY